MGVGLPIVYDALKLWNMNQNDIPFRLWNLRIELFFELFNILHTTFTVWDLGFENFMHLYQKIGIWSNYVKFSVQGSSVILHMAFCGSSELDVVGIVNIFLVVYYYTQYTQKKPKKNMVLDKKSMRKLLLVFDTLLY